MEKELWDFYYSAKQVKIQERKGYSTFCDKRYDTFLNGKRYTECCDKGDKPIGNFDDYIFIGTGTIDNIETKEIKWI